MLKPKKTRQPVWNSSLVALLAVAGALLGFAQAGSLTTGMFEQGGSVFLLVYGLALVLFGLPMMMAWLALGRRDGDPALAVIESVRASKRNRVWGWLGPVWQLLAFLLLVLVLAWAGDFGQQLWPQEMGAGSSFWGLGMFALLVLLVGAGGASWLGRLSALLVLLIVLLSLLMLVEAGQAHTLGSSLQELFALRPGLLGWDGVLQALQLALVSASLGGAALWAYGHYLPLAPTSLAVWSVRLLVLQTLLALLAGVASFALTSSVPMEEGGSALYLLLPPLGALLAAAALTEAVALRLVAAGLKRPLAWLVVLVLATLLAGVKLGTALLDGLQPLTLHWLLPLAVLLLAVLVGWVLKETQVRKSLEMASFPLYLVMRALLRLAVPLGVLVLLGHELRIW